MPRPFFPPPVVGIVLHDFALGGTERIAVRLASRWVEEGARVTIFCGSGAGEMRGLLSPAVRVVEASPPIHRRRGSRAALGRAAARHFTAEPVDVCFLPGNFHWPVAPALAAMPPACRPAIVAQVSAALVKPQRGRLRQRLYEGRMRWLLGWVSAIVTLQASATADVARIMPAAHALTIPLPALDDDVAPPRPMPADTRRLVAVGRLVPEKGFDLLIEAFATLNDPAATLAIIGEGPDRARLERLIARHGVAARVTLPGYVANPRPWLDEARLAVLPSRYEGYPAALVEALAAGRPVVATRCSPAPDALLDRTSGRVVPIDDVHALRDALAEMLALAPPDLAELAGRVAHHRIGAVARRYLSLFAELTLDLDRARLDQAVSLSEPEQA